jgi:hypothetical protein
MSYDLSKVRAEEGKRISPYIGYGSGQVLRINDIELKFSQNTGSPKAVLHMESKPIKEEGFTPVEGHEGRVGKVSCGIYMKDDKSKDKFLQDMKRVAMALGLEDEFNEIKGELFQDVVKQITKVVSGKNKWARYTVFGEEYAKPDGKTGTSYILPKYNFVESVDTEPTTLVQFDPSNKYHLRRLPEQTTVKSEGDDDLPF